MTNDIPRMSDDDAAAYYKLGLLLEQDTTRASEAEAAYRMAAELEPDNARHIYRLGLLLHEKLHNFEEAEMAYRRAIELAPTDPFYYGGLISLLVQGSRQAEAQALGEKMRMLLNASENWYGLATLDAILGNSNEAIESLRKAAQKENFNREWARNDPDLVSIRDDQRFDEIIGSLLEKEQSMDTNNQIHIEDAPNIAGLVFRHFRGAEDYPKMVAVIAASAEADKIERVDTVEDVANAYSHLTNSDPYQDMIFAEIHNEVIAYSRGFWFQEENGPRIYGSVGFLVPAWRRKGIGSKMLRWIENRMRAIADSHGMLDTSVLQNYADGENVGLATMLGKNDYKPIRYGIQMVRPDLENIPDFPMPEGLEVRPVLPEHYRLIWDASNEAFRDHWGYAESTEEDYKQWLESKIIFQPDIWQVAWDKEINEVAGQVRTFINNPENEKYNRKRGYTEFISVRRPWRKRGLARALIVRSLHTQKARGMAESALSADSENISGATRIYEACGFRVTKRSAIYRKPIRS